MNPKKWKRLGSELVDREITPFKILDRWRRWVGYEIEVFEIFYTELPEDATVWLPSNPRFIAITYNTRDSKHYGASSQPIFGDVQGDVMKKARKRRAGARKRQEKNWSDYNIGGQS